MSVIVLLIVSGGVVAAGFLGAFIWAVQTGQFDDTTTPPLRMLRDEPIGTIANPPINLQSPISKSHIQGLDA